VDRGFRQNPLGQTVPHPGQAESPSDVEGQVPDAVAKGQQGLDGGQDAVTAGGGQGIERIGEGLEIGQGDARERLACRAAEAGDVGAVGALGVHGAAVEPYANSRRLRWQRTCQTFQSTLSSLTSGVSAGIRQQQFRRYALYMSF
jgi:hypothetical protein